MSKLFRGKTCVYCAGEGVSSTGDHVFAREFFPVERRGELPKVAACAPCNNAKSKLEHYLTTVLPFGGRLDVSSQILNEMVPRRLAKNAKLHKELAANQGSLLIHRGGMVERAMTVPIEANQLQGLFRFIVRGLIAHHWATIIPASYAVGAGLLTEAGEQIVAPMLQKNGRARANGSVGGGIFEYAGVQAVDDPSLTVWCFKIYGGVTLGGDPGASLEATPRVWAISSREPLPEIFGNDDDPNVA
ncbi:MAG: HNH endonuclease [Phenylobacterium sp.]|uniref:HNH endonuclease n=1 Tax=Phenylobacterium sp. TaxID=1871053 RepID=UPI003BB6C11C